MVIRGKSDFVMICFSLVGLQAFLVGIVVPDPEVMPSWAQKRGIEGTYAELCVNKVCTVRLFPKRSLDLF